MTHHCQNCEEVLSERYIRVFSEDGTVEECIHCSTYREVHSP